MKIQTCEFVEATHIIPEGWDSWFWELISTDAPFSWGDNNRTMVDATAFRLHCEDRLLDTANDSSVPQSDIDAFLHMLEGLGQTYIDLEN